MKLHSVSLRLSSIAMAAALLAPALASAQNIAIVNGKPVAKARAEVLLNQISKGPQAQPRTPELEQQIKDEVVLREIFMQEAERKGLNASPDYKAQIELARQSILIRELFADFQKNNPVTDAEVLAEYNKFKASAGDKEYKARHILVEKEEDAVGIIKMIKGGASFDELAKKNSKDPGSAPKGGDLDWSAPGGYVPEFSNAMVALAKGQMTETPVKSQFGWHIIKVDDIRAATFPPIEEVKPQIQQRLTQQKLATYRDELRAKAKTDYKFGS
jgi:peptidyl-prolyl cis-trans isomerase C